MDWRVERNSMGLCSLTGRAVTSSRVPSFEGGGNVCHPSVIICQKNERDTVDERVGGHNLLSLEEFDKSNGTSGCVCCLRGGGRSVTPSGIIRREDEGDAVDWRERPNLQGLT